MTFQSTSLSRGKTGYSGSPDEQCHLSIHFPLTREDATSTIFPQSHLPFNPLPSHEGRLFCFHLLLFAFLFQSTSLSRGKTQVFPFSLKPGNLSIHFPLTREDRRGQYQDDQFCLSIHFPLTREDLMKRRCNSEQCLSIHFPLTRKDMSDDLISRKALTFNPLPSHEGRRYT